MARHTGGWVKLHRRIWGSWIAKDDNAFRIFWLLIAWANNERSKTVLNGRSMFVEVGQLVTSAQEIAGHLSINGRTVMRKLALLEAEGMVSQQVSNRGRLITISNYNKYQASDSIDCPMTVPTTVPMTVPTVVTLMEETRNKKQEIKTPLTPLRGEPGVSKPKSSDVKEAIGILSSLFTAEPGSRPLKAAIQLNAKRITAAYGIDVVRRIEKLAWESGIMGHLKWKPSTLRELTESAARDVASEKLADNDSSDESHMRIVGQGMGKKNASEAGFETSEASRKFDLLITEKLVRPVKRGLD